MPDEPKPNQEQNQGQPPDYSKFTKDQWAQLAKDDPGTFAEQTQTRFDTVFREARENKEKLSAIQAREKNLLAEINALKSTQSQTTTQEIPFDQSEETKQYGNGVYPQTEEEWNDLALVNPIFAYDLRNEFLQKKNIFVQEQRQAQQEVVKSLITDHSEMYHYEIDPQTNKVKLDAAGKPKILIDPKTGLYAFNAESEKGKLWLQIWDEAAVRDSRGNIVDYTFHKFKNGPQLALAEMERRLRLKGAAMNQNGQNNQSDQGQWGLAPEGVNPPLKVNLKFDSEEEKAHAQKQVDRGLYKSLEDYVTFKSKGENQGYAEPNSRPDFSKR